MKSVSGRSSYRLGVQMPSQFRGGGKEEEEEGEGEGAIRLALHEEGGSDRAMRVPHIVRSGDEKRRWMMNDYEFEDDAHMSRQRRRITMMA